MTKAQINELRSLLASPIIKSSIVTISSIEQKINKIHEIFDLFISTGFINFTIDFNDENIINVINEFIYIDTTPPTVIQTKGYIPWIDDYIDEIQWKFWHRYESYLIEKKEWDMSTVSSIDNTTKIILDHMRYPKISPQFMIKGLVMGDVQSGKTANYTALINKSLDVGYKLIIVLAGLTKDLRNQTQMRLDEEVLGYETRQDSSHGNHFGVGLVHSGPQYSITSFTYSDVDQGDLKKVLQTTPLTLEMQPIMLVVKKNSSILKNLYNFLVKNPSAKNRKIDIPTLIIDDEVDQASINTKNTIELEEATSINRNIRKIIASLTRYSYVGYTATPFANVFIPPLLDLEEEQKDLYPEDFIVYLPTPSKYSGINDYFGNGLDGEENEISLFEDIHDLDYLKGFIKDVSSNLPKSLEDAILHYIIASGVKRARGIFEHTSMLIHISSYKQPATLLKEHIIDHIAELYRRYRYDIKERINYQAYWQEKIVPKSKAMLNGKFLDDWTLISEEIMNVFELLKNNIKVLNSDSDDYVDYKSSKQGQHIVIGGNKLSRGLTLNGLITSYYYRNSKAYDTIMQMGRWFGYRIGWLDLCRVYSPMTIVYDYIRIADAVESFKEDLKFMNYQQLTPRDFGMKIKMNPNLVPTAHSKMKNAVKMTIGLSNSMQQLLVYDVSKKDRNRQITDEFLRKLNNAQVRKNNKIVFKDIESSLVLNFLRKYQETDSLNGRVSTDSWIEYILRANKYDELKKWTIILNSKSNGEFDDLIGNYSIIKTRRSRRAGLENDEIVYLRVITDPKDFREFFEPRSDLYNRIDYYNPNDIEITNNFTSEYGLLSIYVMDLFNQPKVNEKKFQHLVKNGEGVVGLGIWFPKSNQVDLMSIDYYVSPIYIEKNNQLKMDLFGEIEEDEYE